MQAAHVIGHARATLKHDSLMGRRLVIAQPLGSGDDADGPPLLVIDNLGCRVGDRVMLTSDGSLVQEMTQTIHCPARWSVCGIID